MAAASTAMVAVPVSLCRHVAPQPHGTSAAIARFPRERLPPQVEDFGRACARLIRATFPGRSQYATCLAAAKATGVGPDTIDRILGGHTKHPAPRLVFVILAIYQSRTGQDFPIGGGFALRITQAGGRA